MKIAIIGTGYVGLVTGSCLSGFGHQIVCMDTDSEKIKLLKKGKLPIYEPGLQEIINKNAKEDRLFFTDMLPEAVSGAQAVFITVGTPTSRRGDGYADLTFIHEAAKKVAPLIQDYAVVILKSTVPVGTARQVDRIIRENNPLADFDVVSNPEFLKEGEAISDFMKPDRIVIGSESEKAIQVLKGIYNQLYLKDIPFVITNNETAELIKYASNTFLAVKISFINEMANICENVNADVVDLAKAVGLDQRIGTKFLHAGPGYGGSCFPKDTRALIRIAQEHDTAVRLIEAAIEVNSAQKARMVKKIKDALGGNLAGKTIGVLGLTFKPDTDDIREAPSQAILPALFEKGVRIQVYDPQGMDETARIFPDYTYSDSSYEACRNADAVVLMTEWNEFRALDLPKIKKLMREPVFIDLRNVYEPTSMTLAGFKYYGVGRGRL